MGQRGPRQRRGRRSEDPPTDTASLTNGSPEPILKAASSTMCGKRSFAADRASRGGDCFSSGPTAVASLELPPTRRSIHVIGRNEEHANEALAVLPSLNYDHVIVVAKP